MILYSIVQPTTEVIPIECHTGKGMKWPPFPGTHRFYSHQEKVTVDYLGGDAYKIWSMISYLQAGSSPGREMSKEKRAVRNF